MKIKICGLTDVKEAEVLNRYQVDFAGFVLFFPKSRRNISIAQAREIMQALRPSIKRVAVVVSPTPEQARQIEEAGFDYIQIHGELSEVVLAQLGIPVLRAFNVSDMAQYQTCHSCEKIAGYVFDAAEPGSGKVFDWNLIKDIPRDEKLLLLAGGLSAENVAQAIACVRPDGVDVSSGVEYDDRAGKDAAKVERFVAQVRR